MDSFNVCCENSFFLICRRKQLLEIRRQEILKKQEEARKKIEMEKIRLRNLCSQEKKDKNGQTSLHCMAAEPGKSLVSNKILVFTFR